MKNAFSVIMILFFAGMFYACQTAEKQPAPSEKEEVENADSHEHLLPEGLELNNGLKWKADSMTNANVAALEAVIATSKPESLEDYHQAAGAVSDALNKLIKDCRMKGPDHDALHHWLEPFLATNKKLSESKTMEEAQSAFKELEDQIHVYPQFFE